MRRAERPQGLDGTVQAAGDPRPKLDAPRPRPPPGDPKGFWVQGASERGKLLDLDLGAGFLELVGHLLSVGLVGAFLDRLRRRLDQVLGILEAKSGDLAHRLDDADL